METSPIRLIYLASTLWRSGPTQVLLNILMYLDRQRFTPRILTLSPEPADTMLPQFQALDVPCHSLGLSRLQGVVWAASQVRAYMQQHQPNLIQSQGIRADMIAAYDLHGFHRLSMIQNYPFYDYPPMFGKVRGTLMAQQQVRAWRHVDRVIACSATVAVQIQQHGIETVSIPNGVDIQRYQPASPAERQQLRQQLGVPPDLRILISVGSLIPRKDPLTLIVAFLQSRLSQDTLLLLVGDGVLRQASERLAADHPQIRFVGQVSNVADYLRAADLFCSVSLAEGLPNAVLEAIACGLPVCLSDIAPHREILAYRQGAGVTFPVGDVARLTALFNSMPGWDLSRMGQAARAIATEHLSAERMAAAYQAVYLQYAHHRAAATDDAHHRL